MYDACHINGTWGSAEVGQLKSLYEDGKPQSGGPFVLRGDDSPRHHILKKKTYQLLDTSLHSTKGYSRYKAKVKVKNKSIQRSPLFTKNTKEIRIC